MVEIYIKGLGIAGYRSFGNDIQYMGPFNKINLFIGKNNSGKSNILRFLTNHYVRLLQHVGKNVSGVEFNYADKPITIDPHIVYLATLLDEQTIFNKVREISQNDVNAYQLFRKIINEYSIPDNSGPWITYKSIETNNSQFTSFSPVDLSKSLDHNDMFQLGIFLRNANYFTGEDLSLENLNRYLQQSFSVIIPDILLIPDIRKISIDNDSNSRLSYGGEGLIDKLAKLEKPSFQKIHKKEKFIKIKQLLRNIINDETADIEIPADRNTIHVTIQDNLLPIESLGTGIQEAIIIAAAATVEEDKVICLEEPEIHLHPSIQKKLLKYLAEHTSNQYFISTHSTHLLDCPDVSIFHVRLENGFTKVRNVISNNDKFAICADLGYKASDIIQSNCIIWVEGPSDRIYLNHWIHSIDNSLVEGIHYSIMFYGGRLLSHITTEDNEFKEFISLRKMNRKMCIVIDSDYKNESDKLNDTKNRIKEEFSNNENTDTLGFAWITAGREVENYIQPEILEEALCNTHPDAKRLKNSGKYDNCLKTYIKEDGKDSEYAADKIKIAREVVKHEANFDVLDLKTMINKLVGFIEEANK